MDRASPAKVGEAATEISREEWASLFLQASPVLGCLFDLDTLPKQVSLLAATQAVKEPSNNNSILSTGRQVITSTAIRKGLSFEMLSLSECIPWMTVGLAESVAIVTLNLCTIIVLMRNRNLRKRSTYLMINLAVIDMFVGGCVVFDLFYLVGVFCNLWEWHFTEYWASFFIQILFLFPIGSLTNITSIALERVHATFFPFRHHVLKKWVYGLIIAVVWVTSGLTSVVFFALLDLFEEIQYAFYSDLTFMSICLFIICISYTSIVIKVRCGAQPQHHGAASRERKLTMTLLIVTVVSLLLYLPYVVFFFVFFSNKLDISRSERIHFNYALLFLFYANSLVNPILYAIRMPEYRSAFLALFRRRTQQQRQVAVLPLRNM